MIIESAGQFGSPELTGDIDKQQDDVALRFRHIGTAVINHLRTHHCGMPVRQDSGDVYIRRWDAHDFSADLINSYGHLTVSFLNVNYNYQKGNYKKLHVDAGGQFFNPDGVVSDVIYRHIHARVKGKDVKFIALTEPQDYARFFIGVIAADIKMDYPYAFIANTLRDSYINVGKAGIRISKVKPSPYKTNNVKLCVHKGQQVVLDDEIYQAGGVTYYNSPLTHNRAKHLQKLLGTPVTGRWVLADQYALMQACKKHGITNHRIGVVPVKVYMALLWKRATGGDS